MLSIIAACYVLRHSQCLVRISFHKRPCFQHKLPLNFLPCYVWHRHGDDSELPPCPWHQCVTLVWLQQQWKRKSRVWQVHRVLHQQPLYPWVDFIHSYCCCCYIIGHMLLCADWQNLPIKTDSKAEFCSVASDHSQSASVNLISAICVAVWFRAVWRPRDREIPLKWGGWEGDWHKKAIKHYSGVHGPGRVGKACILLSGSYSKTSI